MDLIKLLSNPMQGMMGQELDNVFKRLQGGGQQGQMSPMQYEPEAYQSPFMQQGMNQAPQEDEWEMMRDQMLQRQAADEEAEQAEREAAWKSEWFNENPELAEAVAPLIEGFAPEEAEGWMDAFYEAMQGGDDEFLETVRNEVGEENQQKWDDLVASYMEPEPAADNEYMHKYIYPKFAEEEAQREDIIEMLQPELNNMSPEEVEMAVEQEMAARKEAEVDQKLTLGSGNPDDEDGEEIVDENGIPADGVSFDKMAAAEKNAVSKQMREESAKAQSLIKAHRTLSQMKKLVKEHPNMAQDMAAVFAEPNEDPGFVKQLMQKYFANKKELAAYQKFTKLSSELVLDAGSALGGRNFTDAKMKLIQRSKPSGRMTDDALNYVIDHMMYDWEPAKAYADAIEKGRVGRYQPRMDMESYRGKGKGKKQYTEEELAGMNDQELDAAIAEMENG